MNKKKKKKGFNRFLTEIKEIRVRAICIDI